MTEFDEMLHDMGIIKYLKAELPVRSCAYTWAYAFQYTRMKRIHTAVLRLYPSGSTVKFQKERSQPALSNMFLQVVFIDFHSSKYQETQSQNK